MPGGNPNWVKGFVANPKGGGNWKKGQSGNPSGRPKDKNNIFRMLCKQDAGEVYGILMGIIRDETQPGAVRVNAIKHHTESAFGKATASIKIETDSLDIPEFMPTPQLLALASEQADVYVNELFKTGKLQKYIEHFEKKEEGRVVKTVKAKVKPKPKKKKEVKK
jgi:hypothetical protein